MNNLYEITGNLLAAFVVGLLAYLTPKVKSWMQAHTDAATQENIRKLVQSFARAAEQLYHDQDPPGKSGGSLSRSSCGPWALRSPRRSLT